MASHFSSPADRTFKKKTEQIGQRGVRMSKSNKDQTPPIRWFVHPIHYIFLLNIEKMMMVVPSHPFVVFLGMDWYMYVFPYVPLPLPLPYPFIFIHDHPFPSPVTTNFSTAFSN
jgi:hypothetical protein